MKNAGFRFTLLRLIASILCPEYKMRYMLNWMADEPFNRYLQLVGEAGALKSINAGRRWMVYQLLRLTENVQGDTAECGVYRGATSYLISSFTARARPSAKAHYMFDSFQGLSVPAVEDGSHWRHRDLDDSLAGAKKALAEFKNVNFCKGWIPERFAEVSGRQFSFVHIDVDLYQPTRDSIEFFYPRVREGGVIVCDDYGSPSCPGATKAMDDFLLDKPEKIVGLSDGGGFLIKGTPTASAFTLLQSGPLT